MVIDELVRDEFAIFDNVLLEPDIVLFVKVWLPVRVATVESIDTVTAPEVPPPDKPVPAVTPVISPTSLAIQASPEVVADDTERI